jgi:hypothetical protein
MTEIETFIREASSIRGINPDIAIRVCNSEGGVTEPARLGDFSGPPWYTGKSWYALQLHWGGAGTPWAHFGDTAGMGNGFTDLTGWQPGDPHAWRDAARYGLNRAKASGWGAWYGAKAIGITGYMGIDRQHAWDANAEPWDYETSTPAPLPTIYYTPTEPPHAQEQDWDCSQESAEWALWSVGRRPSDDWMEQQMIAENVVSPSLGLLNASGAGLASFLSRHYGEFGFSAYNNDPVSFDFLAEHSGVYPIMIGGRFWGHWSGLAAYDKDRDLLLLANPSAGWKGVNQTMDRGQFQRLGSFSSVHLIHPDLTAIITDPTPIPPPIPPPIDPNTLLAEIAHLRAELATANTRLGVASVDYANDLSGLAKGVDNVAAALRALRPTL